LPSVCERSGHSLGIVHLGKLSLPTPYPAQSVSTVSTVSRRKKPQQKHQYRRNTSRTTDCCIVLQVHYCSGSLKNVGERTRQAANNPRRTRFGCLVRWPKIVAGWTPTTYARPAPTFWNISWNG
jgi:hypothetical protein